MDLVTGRPAVLLARSVALATGTVSSSTATLAALADKSVITHVRLPCRAPQVPVLGYLELERRMAETGNTHPDARTIFDWICAIRRAKLPDPAVIGNAGSFFKNPVVTAEQCRDIISRDPGIVHYPMPDGSVEAGGWLDDRCLRLEGAKPWAARRCMTSRHWC